MDNVNRAIHPNRIARVAPRGALWGRRVAAALARVRALRPTRDELVLPWIGLRSRPQLLLPGLMVLVALIGIVTALASGARTGMPVHTIADARDLGRLLPPIPAFIRGTPVRSTAIEEIADRPGIAFGAVQPRGWVGAALGLPDPQPGAALGAYMSATRRVSWLAVALTLLSLALLPAVVAGARSAQGAALAEGRPWLWWRVATAPFWLLGLALIPAMGAAAADAVPWWVLSLPVAQWIAQTTLAAAIVVAMGFRARFAGAHLVAGQGLSLVAALAMTPLITAMMSWLTGWPAVLPDPEVPWWALGCVKPALWLLAAGLGATLLLAGATWREMRSRAPGTEPAPAAGRARLFSNIRRRAAMAGQLITGIALIGVGAFGARLMVQALQGETRPNDIQWNEPVTRRQAGQPTSSPPGMRTAFRNFGAGAYEYVAGGMRRVSRDAASADDGCLLEAASALAAGETERVREAAGEVRTQYGAAQVARAAAALRAGEAEAMNPPPATLWSLVAAAGGDGGGAADEAAGLERLIQSLDEGHYLIYSPRRSAFLRVPYAVFPRAGQIALRIALLRRLVALRPRDDVSRVKLAQTLATHERLLTDSGMHDLQVEARLGIGKQREQLCREALTLNPRNWEALVVLGRLDEAIALRPRDAKLRQLRIDRAHEIQDDAHLLEDARQLVALTASDAAHYTLAMAHVRTGGLATGVEELGRLVARVESRGEDPAALPDEFTAWSVNAAVLLARLGRFEAASTLLERARARGGLDGRFPIEPRAVLALLRLTAGDRAGAWAVIAHRPQDRPMGALLPVMAELTIRHQRDQRSLKRVNIPTGTTGFAPRFLAWTDQAVVFDLEPIARAILRRDPQSMIGRYVLADALASRAEPRPLEQRPDAQTLQALRLLHELTRQYPGWIAPLDCLSALCLRLGHFDRASAYQRLAGELYGDQDRSRWLWRSPISGPRLGLPGYTR